MLVDEPDQEVKLNNGTTNSTFAECYGGAINTTTQSSSFLENLNCKHEQQQLKTLQPRVHLKQILDNCSTLQ